jgi:hypothetical protein
MIKLTRQFRAVLERLDNANAPLTAAAFTRRPPFKLYCKDELHATVLSPMLELGLISLRAVRHADRYFVITDAGLDALAAADAGPQHLEVAGPIRISKMTGHYQPGQWPVASTRANHPEIRSRGF